LYQEEKWGYQGGGVYCPYIYPETISHAWIDMEAEHTDASDLNVAEMLCFEVALPQQQLQE